MRLSLVLFALVGTPFGCVDGNAPSESKTAPEHADASDLLGTTDHLMRASMALRGTRPSPSELQDVSADPARIEAIVDTYLESSEFGLTIRDLHNEVWLLRADVLGTLPAMGPLDGRLLNEIYLSTSESPLRFIEHVVMNDRPYTEIVTADYTLANDVLALIYGLPYDEHGAEWQITQWDDGRPRAGMLSESEVYRRWESPASNFHRKRANLLADALLCEPFATRDVAPEGIPDVSDPAAVSNAVFEAPSCVNCHQAMDPLASHLWGFKVQVKRTTVAKGYEANCRDYNLEDESEVNTYVPGQYCYPLEHYTVSDESLWVEAGTRPPGYYGLPSHDLVDLGQNIAADPRFALCTARTFYGYLTQQDKRDVPLALVSDLTEVFVDSGFDAKALARAIVLSESFRAVRTGSDEETGAAGVQVIRPEQFARTIEDLTGFRWIVLADLDSCSMPTLTAGGTNCWGAVDLAVSDQFGFRGMSGGMNSYYSTAPTHTVTPPKETVMARYAAEAAGYVVTADFGESDASARQLLTLVEPWDSDEALVREQIVALYLRILGQFVTSDDESVDATYALFETRLEVDGNGVEAWKLTLTALLLHPRMMFY